MKIIKRILGFLIGLILLLGVVGLFLPSSAHVERSIIITANASQIFPYINNLKKFNEWSPWAKRDPDMKQVYEGPDAGQGAKVKWSSDHPQVGSGSQEIVESIDNKSVTTSLDFGDQGTAIAFLNIEPIDEGSSVTWGFDTEFGMDIMGRYFGLMFDKWIGADYEQGLENLKTLVESSN